MRKNKIIKIVSLVLCGLMCVCVFSGCSKKEETPDKDVAVADPSLTISDNEDENSEKLDRKVKEKSYYLGLKTEDSDVLFKYNGTFSIDNVTYTSTCTYRQLAEKYESLKSNSEKPIDPKATHRVMWRGLPDTTILMFENPNTAAIATSATKVKSVEFAIAYETQLYDLIGQQPKKIDKNMSFIDSVIYLFGTPLSIEDTDNNSLDLLYTYEKCDVNINFDLSTQTGTFVIKYN